VTGGGDGMISISRTVSRNAVTLLAGQILVMLLNLLVVVMLARYWQAENFGTFSYGLVYVGFFMLLPDFGMKPIVVRELARNPKRMESVVWNTVSLKLVLSAMAVVLTIGSAFVFFRDPKLRLTICLLALTIPLASKANTMRTVFESVYHATMEMGYPVLLQLIDGLVQALTVGILVACRADFPEILAGYVLSNIPGVVMTLLLARRRTGCRWEWNRDRIAWLLRESLPLFAYLLLAMAYERIDVLLLKSMWGKGMVGVYASAFRLTAPMVFIPYAVATAIYPVLSRTDSREDEVWIRLFGAGLKFLACIGIGIGVFGHVFGNGFFSLLYGGRFQEAIEPFKLLLWSQGLMFLVFYLVDFNNAQNRQRVNTIYMAVALCLSACVQAVFISKFAALGAGWAKLLLNALGLGILTGLSRRHFHRTHREALGKSVGLYSIFLTASAALARCHAGWIISASVFAGLAGAGFPVLFSRDEWRAFKILLRPRLGRAV
jgi:O-antigen/teichoic acid export membrane protein